jgi:hypothetical protein
LNLYPSYRKMDDSSGLFRNSPQISEIKRADPRGTCKPLLEEM